MSHTATLVTTTAQISTATQVHIINIIIRPGERPVGSVTRRLRNSRPHTAAAVPVALSSAPASRHGGP